MKVALLWCAVAVLLLATPSFAQFAERETILVPVVLFGEWPGAEGSLWRTEFSVYARGGFVRFQQFFECGACLPYYDIPAETDVKLPIGTNPSQPPGMLVFLLRETAANAIMNLRIRDVSREALTWGTELPVVREKEFHTGSITLTEVPTDGRFRAALRVYGVDDVPNQSFHIQIYDETTGALLVDDTRPARYAVEGSPQYPGTVEVTSLTATYPQVLSAERLRIDVSPTDAARRFWAFVSITNNATQHVTTVTPQ
jgi:hypothetical protein